MKYFTFQSQFHQPIIDGVKRSTIRPKQKIQAGERFALRYWMFKPYRGPMGILGTAMCGSVHKIVINQEHVWINGQLFYEEERLAQQEGFASIRKMRNWFIENHGPSFDGFIHSWYNFIIDESAASARRTACLANTVLGSSGAAEPVVRPLSEGSP